MISNCLFNNIKIHYITYHTLFLKIMMLSNFQFYYLILFTSKKLYLYYNLYNITYFFIYYIELNCL